MLYWKSENGNQLYNFYKKDVFVNYFVDNGYFLFVLIGIVELL